MEKVVRVDFDKPDYLKLSEKGVRVIKNRTLLAPGIWNGIRYTPEKIINAFYNTDWENSYASSLIADHRDDEELIQEDKLYQPEGKPLTLRDWLGFVSNQYVVEDKNSPEYGYVKGDLNLCDSELALKLIEGNAPFGVSAFVQFYGDKDSSDSKDFRFMNNAIVVKPACKESYINKKLSEDELNEKLEDISAFERIRKKLGLSVDEFYALPRNPPSDSKLPIFDKTHTRNAMSRFNQTKFYNDEEKKKAKRKIISSAKKFGIKVDKFNKLEDDLDKELDNMNLDSKSLDKDNNGLKGGEKMEEDKVETTEKVESKEVEEVKEPETVEESSEESPEESVEEETEDKLMEQITKATEKLMNKRKLTPEMAKMKDIEKRMVSIENSLKKLQEELPEESEKEEEVKPKESEKLSAKSRTKMVSKEEPDEFHGVFGKGPSQGTKDAYTKLSSLGLFR